MLTTQRNIKGNRVLQVHGKLNNNSATHYEAELFIDGISQGLEAITQGQIKNRYPVLVSAIITGKAII
jgi:hypothetical protein